MPDLRSLLIGAWRTDPTDDWSRAEFGDVTLHFCEDGRLEYTIYSETKMQMIQLTFEVDRNWLVTNQPSHPDEQRVEFFFAEDGRLGLKNPPPGRTAFYIRLGSAQPA